MERSDQAKKTEKAQLNPSPSAGPTPSPAAPEAPQQEVGRKPRSGPPSLEPWMRQTVVLKLKEVDGRLPDMSQEVFGKKMVLEQGFSQGEILSIHALVAGIFYITFASTTICRRYWEKMKAASPDSPFRKFLGSCREEEREKREERRVTVSMRNPHIPGGDISTFLKRFCTVLKEPTRILDGNGFWTSKWSVIVRLHKDSGPGTSVKHLPQIITLGNSSGLIYYPDMPQTCRKCGRGGHQMKDCSESACRVCRVAGHETKDCPRKIACNLCGQATHMYRACPERVHSYASVVTRGPAKVKKKPAPTTKEKKGKSTPRPPGSSQAPSHQKDTAPLAANPTEGSGTTASVTPPEALPRTPSKPSTLPTDTTPPASVVLSPVPRATQPPNSPGAVLGSTPSTTPALSEEDFPPLPSAGTQQRKRKDRDSPCTDSTKKKVVTTAEAPLEDEVEEMEQSAEDLVSGPEYEEATDTSLHTRPVEVGAPEPLDAADCKKEPPPDRSGNKGV
ncbi:uncharacterized protein [Eleutherodactylus coqui]|uniref:uncharacterized protein n=1 Tax=Eleutherodactylus coqui TaxID=57060 RepID=UPI00346253D9